MAGAWRVRALIGFANLGSPRAGRAGTLGSEVCVAVRNQSPKRQRAVVFEFRRIVELL